MNGRFETMKPVLTLRPTLMFARQLGIPVPSEPVAIEATHADWCTHTFRAQRHRYVLFTNTYSLLSVVTRAAGVNSQESLASAALSTIREYLRSTSREPTFERHIEPASSIMRVAAIPDRRVLSSMNELIFLAKIHLIEGGLSPHEVADKLNRTPMTLLSNRGGRFSPGETFDQMPAVLTP